RQIAVEGRKLELIVIVGNHSETTKALNIDGQFRSAFYQLFLVGAARYVLDQPNKNARLTQHKENHIINAAYPALLVANNKYDVVKHPTHGEYTEYQDSGNIPENLEDWDINNLTISIVEKYQSWVDKISGSGSSPVHTNYSKNPANFQVHNRVASSDINSSQVQPGSVGLGSVGFGLGSGSTQPDRNPEGSDINSSQVQPGLTQKQKSAKIGGFSGNRVEPGLTQDELTFINSNPDLSTSKVVMHLWGIKPSKSNRYQDKKKLVESYK
ncbi:MAG: hypothetical protein AAF757_23390, partial [Cyanobacteria bacterium P01_D01_bin.116]